MLKVNLATSDGHVLEFSLPETLSELKYRSKLDFDTARAKAVGYLADSAEGDFNSTYYLYLVCVAVSECLDVSLAEIYTLDPSKLVDAYGIILPDVLQRHVEMYTNSEAEKVDLEDMELSLMTLYEYLYSLVKAYSFEDDRDDFSFTHKGETYIVFKRYKDALLGTKMYEKVSVGELVEAFEVSRWASKELTKATDKASIQLTEVLRLLAILARKEGEVFPMENTDKWIDNRSKEFIDIDFKSASDVFFCLTASLTFSEREEIANTSLDLLAQMLTELTTKSENT